MFDSGNELLAVSRWISPKRTRSYPFERVYDTLAFKGKKAAIIPVVKDEGLGGERDFIQWDTIALLNLLDVRVILAFYTDAEKNPRRADQITKQKLDNEYVLARLKEAAAFAGTTREWNEREAARLKSVLERSRAAYREISVRTKTYLHDETALADLIVIAETPEKFAAFSRLKSENAQNRESRTLQPKEALATNSKGKITITNSLYGKYFFTVDETLAAGGTVHLIEAKHSRRGSVPSRNDIKDGLIKIMLYTNLKNVRSGNKPVKHFVKIRITSSKIKGLITSEAEIERLREFCRLNLIESQNAKLLEQLFAEARENNFTVIFEHADTAK